MNNLNIVIISRTIYPHISPRSIRATELAKEFALKGHNVILYAILGKYNYKSNPIHPNITVKNIENMRFSTLDSDGFARNGIINKVLNRLFRSILEFPDIEFLFRMPSILKKETNCDLLITIGRPHPIHWGTAISKIIINKNNFPKTWISDCGDPYMGDPMNKKKLFYFKYIEKLWCNKTDYITIPLDEARQGYYSEFADKIKVIPQGIKFDNYKQTGILSKNSIPTFAYAGSIYPGKRDPTAFINYLSKLSYEYKFIIYTNNESFYTKYKPILNNKLEIRKYIPRDNLIKELLNVDFLINLTNPTSVQSPSKLIDYLATGKPIIDISKDFDEISIFEEFITGNYKHKKIIENVYQYDISNIVDKFIDLFYENIQ